MYFLNFGAVASHTRRPAIVGTPYYRFFNGKHLGDFHTMQTLNETGALASLLSNMPRLPDFASSGDVSRCDTTVAPRL